MEATADTGVTRIPKHDDEESGYLMLTGGSGEALIESAEEGESNDDHFDNVSGWEEDDGTVHDGITKTKEPPTRRPKFMSPLMDMMDTTKQSDLRTRRRLLTTSTKRLERPSVLWPASMAIPVTRLMGVESTIKLHA